MYVDLKNGADDAGGCMMGLMLLVGLCSMEKCDLGRGRTMCVGVWVRCTHCSGR